MSGDLAEVVLSFARGIAASNRPEDRKLASDYLAALAPILGKTVIGEDIQNDLKYLDRLFGQTWITDVEPFNDAFRLWGQFYDQNFTGLAEKAN
jgi:hypothetical protein